MRFTFALAALSMLPRAIAWGAAGHEIIATIAEIHLHPSALPRICELIDPSLPAGCHLAPIASWADRVRYRMRWSAPLHYVGALDDHPSDTCAFPGPRGWAGKQDINVLGAVRNVSGLLADPATDEGTAGEALRFLVHFVGDLHMPLHLTGRDRGGNSVKVRFDGRQTNLHSLWDGLLIAQGLRNVPHNYSRPLPSARIERALRGAIYDSYVRRIMWEGLLGRWGEAAPEWLACPEPAPEGVWQRVLKLWTRESADNGVICPQHWAAPIHTLNCDLVWPKALDEPPYSGHFSGNSSVGPPLLELDTAQYSGVIRKQWVIEELLAQAGIRLAGILNYLFADDDELSVATVY